MTKTKVTAVDLRTFRSQLDVLAAEYEALKAENELLQSKFTGSGQGKKCDHAKDEDVKLKSAELPRPRRSCLKVNDVWATNGEKDQSEALIGADQIVGAEHVQISVLETPHMAPGKCGRVKDGCSSEELFAGAAEDHPPKVDMAHSMKFVSQLTGGSHTVMDRSHSTVPDGAQDEGERHHRKPRGSLMSCDTQITTASADSAAYRSNIRASNVSGKSKKSFRLSTGSAVFATSLSNLAAKTMSIGSKAKDGLKSIQMGNVNISEWGALREDEQARAMLAGQGRTGLIPIWYDPDARGKEGAETSKELDEKLTKLIENPLATLWICHNCILSPVSMPRMVWDVIAFSLLLYELWIIPFRVIFLQEKDESAFFLAINFAVLTFFAVDIGVNFSTGYVDKDHIEYSRKQIAKKYLAGWFWVDLVATIPWEWFFWNAGGGQTLRFSKAHKVLKTLRFLKMLRAVRMVHQLRRGRNPAHVMGPIIKVLQFLAVMCLTCHIYGCIYTIVQKDYLPADDFSTAIETYYKSFKWAFIALSCGSLGATEGADSPGVWTLEIAVSVQRLSMGVGIICLVIQHMPFLEESAQMRRVKADTIRYLQRHKLSMNTQIQLVYSLNETSKARRMQRHFDQLMQTGLPVEVRRSICGEMWSPRLLSLGLIAQVSRWHRSMIVELAMLVHEEVLASKTILFKEGDAAIAAYCILQGCFAIVSSLAEGIPDFVDGMWLGEKSLVNPLLRRSGTAVTMEMSMVMSVSGQQFHELLARLGLEDEYRTFCRTKLWYGLCGRCGSMGDHFTDSCPATAVRKSGTLDRRITKAFAGIFRRNSVETDESSDIPLSRGLEAILKVHDLLWLANPLRNLNITDLDMLENLDMAILREEIQQSPDPKHSFSHQQEMAISPANIRRFREIWTRETAAMLVHHIGPDQHLIFLSHYKMEAGTEAALMRTELEMLIKEDSANVARNFEVPIFLDSEDLFTLERIQTRVRGSHNLALLLTENVLTRPWVLVEIVTAVVAGVIVLPVRLVKGCSEFQFPDEAFYKRVVKGDFLDQDGLDLLAECHIELSQVEWAIRDVFKRIAVPYSPHRPESIRKPELQALLKQCRLRQTIAKQNEDDGTKPIVQVMKSMSMISRQVG